jgi:hypothetical protein
MLFSSLCTGLGVILAAATLVWPLSLLKQDVSIVDIFLGLRFRPPQLVLSLAQIGAQTIIGYCSSS